MMLADDDVARALHMLIGGCVSGCVHTILWQGTAACMHSDCFSCVILYEFSVVGVLRAWFVRLCCGSLM